MVRIWNNESPVQLQFHNSAVWKYDVPMLTAVLLYRTSFQTQHYNSVLEILYLVDIRFCFFSLHLIFLLQIYAFPFRAKYMNKIFPGSEPKTSDAPKL